MGATHLELQHMKALWMRARNRAAGALLTTVPTQHTWTNDWIGCIGLLDFGGEAVPGDLT